MTVRKHSVPSPGGGAPGEEPETLQARLDLLVSVVAGAAYGLLVVDSRSGAVLFNRPFRELYGIEGIQAMVWVPVRRFSLEVFSESVDASRVLEDLERAHRGETETYSECFLLTGTRESGSWVSYNSAPVRDPDGRAIGRVSVHGDVSEQLLLEKELQDLARLPEINPFAVVRVNRHGMIQYFNPAARDLFQGARLGTPRVGTPLRDEIKEAVVRLCPEKRMSSDVHIAVEGRHLRVTVAPFPDGDQAFVLMEDVTEAREAEKALQEANRQLEQKNRELHDNRAKLLQSEKMAALGNLVAGIAHEINNPVGSINSNNDIMTRVSQKVQDALQEIHAKEDSPPAEDLRRALEVIDEVNRVNRMACERIVKIVKSMKSFARLDEADRKEADIHEGLESTLTLLHHEIKGRIRVVRDFGQVPLIECYPSQLNQVFMNLLANAVQAIRAEGTVTVRTRRVDDDFVRIEIEDDGRGIPEEHLGRIFEPGFTTKGVGVGSGLGLSISYKIIEDHGGRISVESEVGRGTRFTVDLPVTAPTPGSGEMYRRLRPPGNENDE
jgi:signal transduction histidine kinase